MIPEEPLSALPSSEWYTDPCNAVTAGFDPKRRSNRAP
jgi:hypothetical protein